MSSSHVLLQRTSSRTAFVPNGKFKEQDDPPEINEYLQPFEEVKKQAEAALAKATNFLPALDESEHEIADLQRNARDTTE